MATQAELLAATEKSTSREIVVRGVRIHYHDIGTGNPIVGIHGGGPGATAWSNFKQNIPGLAAKNRFLMFDMPGWGRSQYPQDAADKEFISWMGGMLDGFLEALGIEKADVIGNSMGGQGAFGLALRNPKRIKRLVLIGSQPTETVLFQPTPQEGIASIIRFHTGGPSVEKMRAMLLTMVHDPKAVTEELVQERFKAATTPEALEQSQRWVKQPRQDQYFELAKNEVPTLLVWGQDDRGGALEVGLMMLKRFKNARMYIFAKCGHWAQVEHCDEFNRVCLEFFNA